MSDTDEEATTSGALVDARRRAVLDAAADLLDEHAGTGFSMREVAERAGVSAGAVYQWFSGKAEILAVLHSIRFDEELERVSKLPDDLGFPATVESILQGMATIWADTGHHRTTIIDTQSSADHTAFIDGLTRSFRALSVCIEQRLRQAAHRDGLELRPAGELMPWFWAVCIGAGTQLIDIRFIGERGADAYLAGLATPTAAGMVVDRTE